MRISAATATLGVVALGSDAGLREAPALARLSIVRFGGSARPVHPARAVIAAAELIVLGPGSLYTSLLPPLRVREIAEEIGRSSARVVLVMPLMTEPGETDGYVASDFVLTIRQHAPEVPVHDVLLNDAPIPGDRVVRYARRGALPIAYDTEALEVLGCRPLTCDLLGDGPLIHHDPRKLWCALLGLVSFAPRPTLVEAPPFSRTRG